MQTTPSSSSNTKQDPLVDRLKNELRAWWEAQNSDWDSAVTGNPSTSDTDLWDDLPVVDSKAVARSTCIFEDVLGIELDVKCIRKGGYKDLDDFLRNIIPKMLDKMKEATK